MVIKYAVRDYLHEINISDLILYFNSYNDHSHIALYALSILYNTIYSYTSVEYWKFESIDTGEKS